MNVVRPTLHVLIRLRCIRLLRRMVEPRTIILPDYRRVHSTLIPAEQPSGPQEDEKYPGFGLSSSCLEGRETTGVNDLYPAFDILVSCGLFP